jgi:phosphomannomutase
LAEQKQADLLIANDPDADRLAIAVPTPSGRWLPLSGNQVGLLLAEFALSHRIAGDRPVVVTSIVSSPMLESIAAAHGAHCERALTGFKWICTAGLGFEDRGYRFAFGYEEALGYAFGRAVRDKDGISAALAFAELAAEARAAKKTVLECLHALYRRHGLWVSAQHNMVLKGRAGAARIQQALEHAVHSPPSSLSGYEVTSVRDLRTPAPGAPAWRGPALLVELVLGELGRVVVRPSGTEPKLKLYVDLLVRVAADAPLGPAEEQGRQSALDVARALVTALGLDAA